MIREGEADKWENGREKRRAPAKEGRDQSGQGLQRTGHRSLVDQSATLYWSTTSSTARKLAEVRGGDQRDVDEVYAWFHTAASSHTSGKVSARTVGARVRQSEGAVAACRHSASAKNLLCA